MRMKWHSVQEGRRIRELLDLKRKCKIFITETFLSFPPSLLASLSFFSRPPAFLASDLPLNCTPSPFLPF
jgi:hypothetical protein